MSRTARWLGIAIAGTALLLACGGGGSSVATSGDGGGWALGGTAAPARIEELGPSAGVWREVVNDFAATESMVAMDGKLYVICNGLYEVDPTTGAYKRLGTGKWYGTRSMTALDGYLYMVQDGVIYKTDKSGVWTELVDDFAATQAMVALDGMLYVICNGLYRVDPKTGAYERLGTGKWDGTPHLTALDGSLYMVQGGVIYETDKAGAWTEVVGDFAATESMVAMNGFLYVICNGLYRVDPKNGEFVRLGTGKWNGTRNMTALGEKLYMVQDGIIYETAAW